MAETSVVDRIRTEQILEFLVRKLEAKFRYDALQLAIQAVEYSDTKELALKRIRQAWDEVESR